MVTVIQAAVSGILMGGVYGLIAVGLTLIFGIMKIINFAHGSFMMLGMYASYWVFVLLGIDPYLSILISFGTLFIIGILTQVFFDRAGHRYSSAQPLIDYLRTLAFFREFGTDVMEP